MTGSGGDSSRHRRTPGVAPGGTPGLAPACRLRSEPGATPGPGSVTARVTSMPSARRRAATRRSSSRSTAGKTDTVLFQARQRSQATAATKAVPAHTSAHTVGCQPTHRRIPAHGERCNAASQGRRRQERRPSDGVQSNDPERAPTQGRERRLAPQTNRSRPVLEPTTVAHAAHRLTPAWPATPGDRAHRPGVYL